MMDLEKIVRLGAGLGADECEVFWTRSGSYGFSTAGKEVKVRENDSDQGCGVRVIKGGRMGFGFFTQEKNAEKALKNALALSKYCEKADYHFPRKKTPVRVRTFDTRVAELDERDALGFFKQLFGAIGEKKAEASECFLSFGSGVAEIANSSGLAASEKSTRISCYAACNYGGKSGGESFASSFLQADFQALGRKAAENAIARSKAGEPEKGEAKVALTVPAICSFLGFILPSFNGDRVRRGASRLAGKAGEKVASEKITLADDPFARAVGARAFDGEGSPSKKKLLIEKGVVKNFLFDMKSACLAKGKVKARPGNCARGGYEEAPGIGSSNLVLASGKANDVLEEVENGILVDSFFGGHTANKVTGDYSVSVDLAFEIKDGGLARPLSEFTLSGNAFEALGKTIAIEKKPEVYYSLVAPRIAFAGARIG